MPARIARPCDAPPCRPPSQGLEAVGDAGGPPEGTRSGPRRHRRAAGRRATWRRPARAAWPPPPARGSAPWRSSSRWIARGSTSRSRVDPPAAQRGRDAGGLAGHPALRDLPEEGVGGGVARDVPSGPRMPSRSAGTSEPYGTEMFGTRGERLGETPISSSHTRAGVPLRLRDAAEPAETPAVADADLRRAQHEVGVLEARRVRPVDLEVPDHQLPGLDLDRRQVVHVDGAVARTAAAP